MPGARPRTESSRAVLCTSALTPTMDSVPSAKQIRALPYVAGRISVSAISGRNVAGERPSGRMGGVDDRDVCRYDSSAGDSRVCAPAGAIADLVGKRAKRGLMNW